MNKLLSIVFFTIIAISSNTIAASFKPYKSDVTPPLELKDLQGNTHKLSDYKGKIVIVQFWATYCTPCRTEMPSMNRLMKKMGDDFVILAVDMSEPKQQVQAFVDEVKPEFTILLDENGESIGNWKVFAAPSSFVIDKNGKARYTVFGGMEWDSEQVVTTLQSLK